MKKNYFNIIYIAAFAYIVSNLILSLTSLYNTEKLILEYQSILEEINIDIEIFDSFFSAFKTTYIITLVYNMIAYCFVFVPLILSLIKTGVQYNYRVLEAYKIITLVMLALNLFSIFSLFGVIGFILLLIIWYGITQELKGKIKNELN